MEKRRTSVMYHGLQWVVEGFYVRGETARLYEKNGDPGTPGVASDLLDATITIANSDEMSDILTQDAVDTIINRALETFDDPDFAAVPW